MKPNQYVQNIGPFTAPTNAYKSQEGYAFCMRQKHAENGSIASTEVFFAPLSSIRWEGQFVNAVVKEVQELGTKLRHIYLKDVEHIVGAQIYLTQDLVIEVLVNGRQSLCEIPGQRWYVDETGRKNSTNKARALFVDEGEKIKIFNFSPNGGECVDLEEGSVYHTMDPNAFLVGAQMALLEGTEYKPSRLPYKLGYTTPYAHSKQFLPPFPSEGEEKNFYRKLRALHQLVAEADPMEPGIRQKILNSIK